MTVIYTWKENHKDYLYRLYLIFLKNIENFKEQIDNESLNLPNTLNYNYYHSEEFIQRFIKLMYLSSSKNKSEYI
jgi:hypothetical protein